MSRLQQLLESPDGKAPQRRPITGSITLTSMLDPLVADLRRAHERRTPVWYRMNTASPPVQFDVVTITINWRGITFELREHEP